MPRERPAAEIEPVFAMALSRAILPGPIRPPESRSIRRLREGIASIPNRKLASAGELRPYHTDAFGGLLRDHDVRGLDHHDRIVARLQAEIVHRLIGNR